MNKQIASVILFILILIICFESTVVATDINDLQNKKDELQSQIEESNEEIKQIQINITENLEQLSNLNLKIETYQNDIETYEDKLLEVKSEIDEITPKLNVLKESYDTQKENLQLRIVSLYEAGDIVYLDVLLKSDSFSNFISNYFLIGEIIETDNNLLETIERQKTKIEEIKNVLEQKEKRFQLIKDNKEKTTIALENSKIIRNSYINKLTKEEKITQNKIDKYQQELNNLEAQIVALTTENIGEDYIGGEFAWPAPGYTTITSKFGMRLHPVLKTWRLHTGTDIAMPTGAYIIAANDGIVIKSMYTTGYGNMILINHGGGVVTLYGHGSELIAKTGQTVKKGDIIMKAGSTRLVDRTTFTF